MSIKETAFLLRKSGVSEENIAVITAYTAQKELIIKLLKKAGLERINVGTVDSF